ncbi:MAG: hypothetical protein LQ352_005348 [Teloschistes flavicans]|nr:MAG: hypothetical protein LQ352_005348 [Teloschistes flavicans]
MDPRHNPTTFPTPPLPLKASAPNSPTPSSINDTDPDVPPKRRRTSGAASRGVANLTPQQLAKKRANDREAQRAIRERTKTQIETLEKKIHHLTNQQPHQELQAVLRQKQYADAENLHIKKTLNAALALLQPLLRSHGGETLDAVRQDASRTSSPNLKHQAATSIPSALAQFAETATIRSRTSASPTYGAPSPVTSHPSPVDPTSYNPQASLYPPRPASLDPQQRDSPTHGMSLNTPIGERLNLGFLLDSQQQQQQTPRPQAQHSPHQPPLPMPSFPRMPSHPPQPQSSRSTDHQHSFTPPPHTPYYALAIRNIPSTCPLDTILLDFLESRRSLLTSSQISPSAAIGPAYPSVASLLNPERAVYAHPLSKLFTDILSKFPDLSHLPEQVAVLYVMFLIMRWQISPTQENYERLPEWVTPRPSQLFTPHPAWIDHLPWPRMRDRMVELYPGISLDDWFIPYTTTLSLNWPYEDRDALLHHGRSGGGVVDGNRTKSEGEEEEFTINPVFERHLRDLGNWTLGPAFEKTFPQLVATYKIKREERGRGG